MIEAINETDDVQAQAVLDYTRLSGAGVFQGILDAHGLERTATMGQWILWCNGDGLHLECKADPLTGEVRDDRVKDDDPGYMSTTKITGPASDAAELLLDIVCNATYLKGEERPLTTRNGDVVASLSTPIGGVHWNINGDAGRIKFDRELVAEMLAPTDEDEYDW